jgi:hypothetical protein
MGPQLSPSALGQLGRTHFLPTRPDQTRKQTCVTCVDDVCVAYAKFLRMEEGQTGAAGAPMLRDTVEAPAETPTSSEENDSGDVAEPTSTELQSEDDALPRSRRLPLQRHARAIGTHNARGTLLHRI